MTKLASPSKDPITGQNDPSLVTPRIDDGDRRTIAEGLIGVRSAPTAAGVKVLFVIPPGSFPAPGSGPAPLEVKPIEPTNVFPSVTDPVRGV